MNPTPNLKDQIIAVLKNCYDPEIPVSIYELGLIYNIDIDAENIATIKMTLTSPNCPVAESLPSEVQEKVKAVPGIHDAKIDLVWEPTWEKEMMSDEAKLELGLV
jgi:FeS assembly SUF system protein